MDEDQSIDNITEENTDIGVTLEEIIDPHGQNKQDLEGTTCDSGNHNENQNLKKIHFFSLLL